MVLHPREFAIYNKVSINEVKRLGFPTKTLQEFQESVGELASELEIDDFVTLDYLLYVSSQTEDQPEVEASIRTWLFQFNPKVWSFADHVDEFRKRATDTWTVISSVDYPGSRINHIAVWADDRMLVWGDDTQPNQGHSYDPVTDQWTLLSTVNQPSLRRDPLGDWTGSNLIV